MKKPKTDLTDKVASLLEIAYAVGAMIAPVIGGGLNDIDGFTFAVTVLACLTLIFSFIFSLVMFCKPCCK